MSRPLRIEFEGAVYHVTSRGDRREAIFEDDEDRVALLAIVALGLERFGATLFAYCLMGNHYHFVMQTHQPNLSRLMRHINGVYTQAYNRRQRKVGHLSVIGVGAATAHTAGNRRHRVGSTAPHYTVNWRRVRRVATGPRRMPLLWQKAKACGYGKLHCAHKSFSVARRLLSACRNTSNAPTMSRCRAHSESARVNPCTGI